MQLLINDHRKIVTIQKDFSSMFPFLKIEFYAKPHTVNGASSKKIVEHPAKTLGQCRVIHKKGMLSITPEMTVTEVEQTFRDVYGLSVEIFRKSGHAWLGTSVTGGWSLKKQNDQGEALSFGSMPAETDFESQTKTKK